MLKKHMKKIFESLYLFSKFGISFTLLICLFVSLYILYVNYQKEGMVSQNQSIVDNELLININKNTSLINEIFNEVKINEKSLSEITKYIETIPSKSSNEDYKKIYKSIDNLNKNFEKLSREIKDIKNKDVSLYKNTNKTNELKKENKVDIVNLILLKYENNINFEKELEYLATIVDETDFSNIEKLSILSKSPYKGHQYLIEIFDNEVNDSLKIMINQNPESFLSKVIMPYVNISPTSENKITSDLVMQMKEIKLNIQKGNIEEALKTLILIKEYDKMFALSSLEMKKYIEFKKYLSDLI